MITTGSDQSQEPSRVSQDSPANTDRGQPLALQNQPAPQRPLEALLNSARERLIEVGRKTPLLNYKLPKSSGIGIDRESPIALYRILVTERKRMYFDSMLSEEKQPQTDSKKALAQVEQPPLPDEMLNDDRIQTLHTGTDLQARLVKTAERARLDQEERGIHTLYVALGLVSTALPDGKEIRAPLVLIPVTLKRMGAQGRFSLITSGDGPTHNYALEAHLKKSFDIALPTLASYNEADSHVSLSTYFDDVVGAIGSIPNTSIDRDACALGIFSFEGVSLYNDLDPANWPQGKTPLDSTTLTRLVDGVSLGGSHKHDAGIDYTTEPGLVMPVDPSQLRCVAQAARGEDLIIHGPPGTGKSHTITNIIASLVRQNKKVLVVSQKAPALQIVKGNLDSIGLGDLALLLHSDTMPRREVMRSLKETFERPAPRAASSATAESELKQAQRALIDHADKAERILGTSGLTFHDAVGRAALSADLLDQFCNGSARPPISLARKLTSQEFQAAYDTAYHLQEQIGKILPITDHVFFGSEVPAPLLPAERESARLALKQASDAVDNLSAVVVPLCTELGLPAPDSFDQTRDLVEVLQCIFSHLLDLSKTESLDLTLQDWRDTKPRPSALLSPLVQLAHMREQYKDTISHQAWEFKEPQQLLETLKEVRHYWLPSLRSDYRTLRATLRGFYVRPPRMQSWESWEKLLKDLQEAKELKWTVSSPHGSAALARLLTNSVWQGVDTDLDLAKRLVSFGENFVGKYSDKPYFKNVCRIIQDKSLQNTLRMRLPQLREVVDDCSSLTDTALVKVGMQPGQFKQQVLADSLAEFAKRLKTMEREIEKINELAEINLSCATLTMRGVSISPKTIEQHAGTISRCLAIQVENAWSNSTLANTDLSHRSGTGSRGTDLVSLSGRYIQAREALLIENRYDIAQKHWQAIPRQVQPGQIGYMHRELAKKKNFKSIRELMRNAGAAVQLVKPVVLASPAAIARFLTPQSLLHFDAVIIDEGSQVPPEDALGSLARAAQMIIVGDTRQMPPTRFFVKASALDPDSEETALVSESVLDMAVREGLPSEMLTRHRRSFDTSLIELASRLHYDNRLEVTPSPVRYAPDQGLQLTRVLGAEYGRGETATNPVEATAVVQAIKSHVCNHPHRSLGVVTFNIKQAEEILMQLEERAQRDAELFNFIHFSHPEKPFFVKSLESVQGDERDTILISVGIGYDSQGRFLMNFGPLSNQGGERRLNVLMTRARWECRLFVSFDPSDLRVEKAGEGPRQLKQYLEFAQKRSSEAYMATTREIAAASNSFARALQFKLEKAGLTAEELTSGSGLSNLAVIDPKDPSRYALSIVLDGMKQTETLPGAALPELLSALESSGWITYVVSTDDLLFRPDQIVAEICGLVRNSAPAPMPKREHITVQLERSASRVAPQTISTDVKPYTCANISGGVRLFDNDTEKLGQAIREIVRVESPVHVDEVYFRLRAGARDRDSWNWKYKSRLCDLALTNSIHREGEFLFVSSDTSYSPIRDRSQFSSARKSIEFVYDKEIRAAILHVVTISLGISEDELAATTLELLGLSSQNTDSLAQVRTQIRELLNSEELLDQSGFLIVQR